MPAAAARPRAARRLDPCIAAIGLAAIGLVVLPACRVTSHPTEPHAPPAAASTPKSWDEVLDAPVDLEVRTVVSARWEAKRKGLVNLRHPVAKEAGLKNETIPIVLHVGVIRHPDAGDFIVDTGVDTALAQGDRDGAVRGLLRSFTKSMEPLEPLAAIVAREELEVRGVLLTHSHVDHILGLPDLAPEVPIYVGPGELSDRRKLNGLLRPTHRRLFDGRDPVRELDPATMIALDPFPAVIDLLGDGSIWGILCEGHTKGSMAWLVNAAEGPALFVGDSSHTRWGWEHGVEPGKFTSGDHALNAEVLQRLRAFVEQHPEVKVYVGHEL
ncbi:MBL fold metallo-hydrolase [Paraliomyxa miuraensis]|uniref:MBL fold metallo-hydrolase n=1 Tax=Paraliomyxa miuraensis TaxID=376150 RepID=UPI00224E4E16|nr:MBL fold metallo-hydrolase [Paraliomyxa miuraensis]MCX4244345.1 MBL fold metallo-hydrolase [Paraliomyxa miuraensis]